MIVNGQQGGMEGLGFPAFSLLFLRFSRDSVRGLSTEQILRFYFCNIILKLPLYIFKPWPYRQLWKTGDEGWSPSSWFDLLSPTSRFSFFAPPRPSPLFSQVTVPILNDQTSAQGRCPRPDSQSVGKPGLKSMSKCSLQSPTCDHFPSVSICFAAVAKVYSLSAESQEHGDLLGLPSPHWRMIEKIRRAPVCEVFLCLHS